MNNTVYLAQIVWDVEGSYSDCEFVGVFTTRKNAEDAICDILSKRYNKTIYYKDYSTMTDFLEEHSNDYIVTKLETDKNYY